ncbi:MAG: serine hydrolase, partial [Sphingomonas parapaucimobilis]
MRFTPLSRLILMGIATCCAIPAPASARSLELVELQRDMNALLSGRSGEYGIAAIDLDDGSTALVNGQIPFPMASTVKLAIAGAYLAEVDQGRRSLNDMVNGRTAAKAMEAMIVRSDNLAADQMFATLGGPAKVQQWVLSNNISGMRVDRTIAQLLRERGHLADIKDVATPVAMVQLLRILDSGTALSNQSRAYLLGLMRQCRTGTRRIRGLLPAGT